MLELIKIVFLFALLVFVILPFLIFIFLYPLVLLWVPIKKIINFSGELFIKGLSPSIKKYRVVRRLIYTFRKYFSFDNNQLLRSFLNIPLILYPVILFPSALYFGVADTIFSAMGIQDMGETVSLLVVMEAFALLNYFDIIFLNFLCEKENNTYDSKISATLSDFDIHLDLLKKIIGPVSLISIVSGLVSLTSLFIPEFKDVIKIVFEKNIQENIISLVVYLATLILYSSVNYFILSVLKHVISNSKNYFYWYSYMLRKVLHYFGWL